MSVRRAFRHRATRKEWADIARYKDGPCRGCDRPGDITFHHVVPRSLAGDDVPNNIIPLCGHGTAGCHGAIENHTPGWERVAANIRASLTDSELAYVLERKGDYWLDRYYPEERLAA